MNELHKRIYVKKPFYTYVFQNLNDINFPLKYPKNVFVADILEWRRCERILFVNLGEFF